MKRLNICCLCKYKACNKGHVISYDKMDEFMKKMNKDFDLIIANPPYGVRNTLTKKIAPNLLKYTNHLTYLSPKDMYKDNDLWNKVEVIKIVEDKVFDADIRHLSIATLTNETNNEVDFEEVGLTEKQLKLLNALNKYNEVHELTYKVGKWSGTQIGNKLNKTVERTCITGLCSHLEPIRNMTLNECLKTERLFVTTVYSAQDGVHINDAHDYTYNFGNKWPEDWSTNTCPVNPIMFLTKEERNNFRTWWYSCVERERVKKLRSGLTNACLDLMYKVRRKGSPGYEAFFPHLDWTRKWTDKEVLVEIGLPEDFLEE